MFLAYYLRKDGYEVRLIDKDPVGREASVYNAGLLTPSFAPTPQLSKLQLLSAVIGRRGPLYISPMQVITHLSWFRIASGKALTGFEESTMKIGKLSLRLYEEFFSTENIDPDLAKGVVGLYRTVEDAKAFSTRFGGKLLEPAEISRMGYKGLEGGILVESEFSINPAKLFKQLRTRIQEMGVVITLDKEARLDDGARPRARYMLDGKVFEADSIIVSAGSWTRTLCNQVGFEPEILPASGLVMIYDTGGRRVIARPTLLEDYGIGIAQHDDHTLRVTSFFEMVGFKKHYGEGRKKWLVDIVSRHVTDLSKFRLVEEGIGFRPCTPDQFSVIGRVPYYENLYVASGNCRLGVTLAPASAYILRSIIRGEDCLDEIKPLLSPERFHS